MEQKSAHVALCFRTGLTSAYADDSGHVGRSRVPPARQAKILDQIMSAEENIGTFLKFSILDDARRQIIAWVTEGLDGAEAKDRPKLLKMIRKESRKLAI